MSTPPPFLLEWAGRPGPRLLLEAARGRIERGKLGARSVLDVPLTPSQRTDVGWLMPAGWVASGEPVRTKLLRDGVAGHGTRLEELLVATGGPLRDVGAELREHREARDRERSRTAATVRSMLGTPLPDGWGETVDAVLDRIVRGVEGVTQAEDIGRVLASLDAEGEVGLPVLAAHLFRDAHALDRSRPLGRAVARVLALRAAVLSAGLDSDAALSWVDPLSNAEAWRAAWASGGVICDAVSSQVLVLNLPLEGDAPAVGWCRAVRGEPLWLTLRSLRGAFSLPAPVDVFVCENPSIVEAAADHLGVRCPPLVCSYGRPSAALWTLLRGLDGARLHVRADADAVGWSIVASLLDQLPHAIPWRMPEGSSEYEEEVLPDLLADLTRAAGEP